MKKPPPQYIFCLRNFLGTEPKWGKLKREIFLNDYFRGVKTEKKR